MSSSSHFTTALAALALVVCAICVFSFGGNEQLLGRSLSPRAMMASRPMPLMAMTGQRQSQACLKRFSGRHNLAVRVSESAADASEPVAADGEEVSDMPPGFWEYALRESDLGRGQRRIVTVGTPFSPRAQKKIVVARVGKEGNVFAFDYMCPHLAVSLADGKFGVSKRKGPKTEVVIVLWLNF